MKVITRLARRITLNAYERKKIRQQFEKRIAEVEKEEGDYDSLAYDVEIARDTLRLEGDLPRERFARHELPYLPPDDEVAASAICSKRMLADLSVLPDVVAFRERCLGGIVLTEEEGDALKRSPLATIVPATVLAKCGLAATDTRWLFRPIYSAQQYRYEVAVSDILQISVYYDHEDLLKMGYPVPEACQSAILGAINSRVLWYDGSLRPAPGKSATHDRTQRAIRLFNLPYSSDPDLSWTGPLPKWMIDVEKLGLTPFGFARTLMGDALQLTWDIAKTWHLDTARVLNWLLTGRMVWEQPVNTNILHVPMLSGDGKVEQMCWSRINISAEPWVAARSIENEFLRAEEIAYKREFQERKEKQKVEWEQKLKREAEDQDCIRPSERPAAFRTRKRLPNLSAIQTYTFVINNGGTSCQRSGTWERLARGYHKEHGEKYTADAFQQKFDRAEAQITNLLRPEIFCAIAAPASLAVTFAPASLDKGLVTSTDTEAASRNGEQKQIVCLVDELTVDISLVPPFTEAASNS